MPDETTVHKPRYTRFRLLLDVFSIVFALLPAVTRVLVFRLNAGITHTVPFYIYGSSILLLFVVALAINISGSIRGRPVSIVGLLCNLCYPLMAIMHWQ